MIPANEKWIVYGTGEPSGWQLSVAAGATVTLSNVNLSDASIVCYGNNTIILADGTTNSVTEVNVGSTAIMYMGGDGTTLTITGTGTLNVTGGYYAPAIGVENPDYPCGAITIESTVHLTATAGEGQSKAITTGTGGGTVTIGGVVYADGTGTPFVYPAPACSYTAPTLNTTTVTYSGSAQAFVTAGSATNATIYYKVDYTNKSGSTSYGEWSTSVPSAINAGSYTVYYKVVPADGYAGGVESTSLGTKTINKANGWVNFSPGSSSGWGATGYTTSLSVSISHHGGALSITGKTGSSDLSASISGNTLNLSRKNSISGTGTVTVTSAANNNYNAASNTFRCNP